MPAVLPALPVRGCRRAVVGRGAAGTPGTFWGGPGVRGAGGRPRGAGPSPAGAGGRSLEPSPVPASAGSGSEQFPRQPRLDPLPKPRLPRPAPRSAPGRKPSGWKLDVSGKAPAAQPLGRDAGPFVQRGGVR